MSKVGRPPRYRTAEELQAKVDRYFSTGVRTREMLVGSGATSRVVKLAVPTITGLVLYLGFCDRHTFYSLELKPEFSHVIKSARERIQMVYEEQLHTSIPTGAIFALKNFGWRDVHEVQGQAGEMRIVIIRDKAPAVVTSDGNPAQAVPGPISVLRS